MNSMVMKFGGTSVGNAARIADICRIARSYRGMNVLVVVSAMSGITDSLFRAGKAAKGQDLPEALGICAEIKKRHLDTLSELAIFGLDKSREIDETIANLESRLKGVYLLSELSPRTMDEIASVGERLSSILVSSAIGCACLDARSVMRTDSRFGEARPDMATIKKLAKERIIPVLKSDGIAVTQGYIGSDESGVTTTLGRGGSDYSASLFGAAIGASEIQIWTDVEGILTADPRVVPEAKTVEVLGYDEAAELAAYGAKVLHPATIRPALDEGIPVTVRSTMKPDGLFSTIRPGTSSGRPAVALAMRKNVAIINLKQVNMADQSGFLAELFEVFGRRNVSVDLVSTSEVCVSVSLNTEEVREGLVADLEKLGSVEIVKDRVVIAIVGDMLKQTPAVLRRVFGALGDTGIDLISMGANNINLSLIVKNEDAESAMRKLHTEFFVEGVAV
jgi:aspartate kinase